MSRKNRFVRTAVYFIAGALLISASACAGRASTSAAAPPLSGAVSSSQSPTDSAGDSASFATDVPLTEVSEVVTTAEVPSKSEVNVAPPPTSLPAGPTSVDEISLPTGPGILLLAGVTADESAKWMAANGVSDEDLRAQQTLVEDIPADIPFSVPDGLQETPRPLPLTGANTPLDDIVVVNISSGACDRLVGGYAYAVDGNPVVVLYGGLAKVESCISMNYTYRLTLYVPGAKAGSVTESVGGEVQSGEVALPMLDTLPKLMVLPKDLPAYSR